MSRLVTEWSTDDPKLAELLKRISDEPNTEVRLEMEAALHTMQAADCIRRAERVRLFRSRYPRRRAKVDDGE